MSGRHLYIEEHDDDATPVTGCGCEGAARTFGECEPVTDGALTAGDPSPCARCPDCDGLVYLDRPQDRAGDALRHLIWRYAQEKPGPQGSYVNARIRLENALGEALGRSVTITIA